MINERIKSLKGSLETCENMLATGVLNEYSTALYKSERTCTEDELNWLEQLKEYMLDINKKITETEDSDTQVILYMAMFNGLFGCNELISDSNE